MGYEAAIADSTRSSTEDLWLKFLSRWSLITALIFMSLIAVFFIAVASDVPMDKALLIGAARRPFAHRLHTSLDSAGWLGIGGVLLAFASVLAARAPIRSAFIAACGIGQLIGSAGGFILLYLIEDLATRYTRANPDVQTTLMQTSGDFMNVAGSLWSLGALLYGAGFVLIASVIRSDARFPRWLAVWIGLAGIYPIVQRLLAIAAVDLRPYFSAYLILGQIALYIAIAVVFWRRRARPTRYHIQ